MTRSSCAQQPRGRTSLLFSPARAWGANFGLYGQIIDVYVPPWRDTRAALQFFTTALDAHGAPVEVGDRPGVGVAGCDR